MRILLTGAAGFIGAPLARLLLAEGHDILTIIRPETNRRRLAGIEHDLVVLEGDLRALPILRARIIAARPEICLHLAWRGWAGKAEADHSLSSLSVSIELLRLLPEIGCRRFMAIGTCFEYECTTDRLAETTPLRPQGFNALYGTCKKSLVDVAEQFAVHTGLSVVTGRLFNSYGPFEDVRRLVPAITLALLRGEVAQVTKGEQVRDYLHARDVAAAIWHVAQSGLTGSVNIASGEPVTIAEIATSIADLVGRPDLLYLGALPYRRDEPMRILADTTILRQHLGWRPHYNLQSGLTETVQWWETHVGVEARAS